MYCIKGNAAVKNGLNVKSWDFLSEKRRYNMVESGKERDHYDERYGVRDRKAVSIHHTGGKGGQGCGGILYREQENAYRGRRGNESRLFDH